MRNFKRKSQYLWNMSCPLCGDSTTRRHAARGFIYRKGEQLNYRCHKCGAGMSVKNFIAAIDSNMHKEMQLDLFQPRPEVNEPIIKERPVFDRSLNPFKGLIAVSDLAETHLCRRYVAGRFIPEHVWSDLFYTDTFYTWSNTILPGKYKIPKHDEPRLVIPMRNRKGEVTAFQGRSLNGNEPKYIFVALSKDEPLIYGLDKISLDQIILVFEGPIDAMFVPNAIACGGGDIASDLLKLDIPKDKFVIVYDNEPRKIVKNDKKEIFNPTAKKIEKAINTGFSVCIWPEMQEKDVNDMVKKHIQFGLQAACQFVFTRINDGIYSGAAATMALTRWNKVKHGK